MSKIALVCDWLTNVGGAERVLLALHQIYPDAPIYTSQYNPKKIDWFRDADVRTGWLQHLPSGWRRVLGPFRQRYFSRLDLSDYDVVISVTGAEAKSVRTENKEKGTKAYHFCYCHVPTQYYYEFYDQYVKDPGFGWLNPIVRFFFKLFVKPLRRADQVVAKRPDQFITISTYAATQIQKYYNRESIIVNPPVDVEMFSKVDKEDELAFSAGLAEAAAEPERQRPVKTGALDASHRKTNTSSSYFINFSRQVTWKRLDLCIQACLETGQKLLLIGDGPEHQKLVQLAAGSDLIKFLPSQPQAKLGKYLSQASAFIFPSCEPFGIAPVEALAAGVPVIAYGAGGALDYIKDGENGLLFDKQTAKSLAATIEQFNNTTFKPAKVKKSAENYSRKIFQQKIKSAVAQVVQDEKTH